MDDKDKSQNKEIDYPGTIKTDGSCLEVKDLTELNTKKIFIFKGRQAENQLVDSFPVFKKALKDLGFNDDTYLVVKQFVGETVSNALKSYGSKQLFNKYDTFEDVLKEENSKEIIDREITEGYDKTIIRLTWKVMEDKLILKMANNTPLNDYMEERIKKSLYRDKDLTQDELMNIGNEGTLFDTKASGMGIGLWMVKKILEKVERGNIYYLRKPDETEFVMKIAK